MDTTNTNDVKARLAALGFKAAKAVGLNILTTPEGEPVFIKITAEMQDFQKKDGKVFKYIPVINLETGEEGNIWVGGQLRYQLEQFGKYIGQSFILTYNGLTDVDGEDMHQYDLKHLSN